MAKKVTIPGITFNGKVIIKGPMIDVHDNEHVHFGESEKGQPGRKAKKAGIEKMLLCPEAEREIIIDVLQEFIDGEGAKETVLTLKAAVSLNWLSNIPSHAVAVDALGCESGSTTYNDYKTGKKIIYDDEIESIVLPNSRPATLCC